MYNAEEMRKLTERARESFATDYYYTKLESKISERIKTEAECRNSSITITFGDSINDDRWMDNSEIRDILQSEVEKLGYKYKYTTDRDGDWITISW